MSLIAVVSYSEGQTGGNQISKNPIWGAPYSDSTAGSQIEDNGYSVVKGWGFTASSMQLYNWSVSFKVDTLIPTPDTTLRKLLIAGEERNNFKRQVVNLEEQIKLLNDVIKEHTNKDEIQRSYYENQMTGLREQLQICKEQVLAFEKIVRRERRKRFWTGASGLLTTGVMT